MREPVDNWWQQQLQGYTATPHPADWDAVYARLHGRRHRRLVWWVLPLLLAALVAGTLAYRSYFADGEKNKIAGKSISPAPQKVVDDSQGIENATTPAADTQVPEATAKTQAGEKAADSHKKPLPEPSVANTRKVARTQPTPPHGKAQPQQKAAIPFEPPVVKNTMASTERATIIPMAAGDSSASTHKGARDKETASVTGTKDYSNNTTQSIEQEPNTNRLTLLNGTAPKKNTQIPAVKSAPSFTPVSPAIPNVALGKKIPTRSLQWWPYMAVGITSVASNAPFDMRKSFAISNDLSSGAGGSSRVVYAGVGTLAGMHAGAGMLVQKPLGKRTDLRTGLGVAYSTWQEEGNIFRDSTLPGGTNTTRQTLGTYRFGYQYLAAQVPVLFSGRIGPARKLQWGWAAGLQNNFSLGLTEERNSNTGITTGSGNFTQQEQKDAITTKTRLWQPALQVGFYLRHEKKSEWQLEPRLSLPLSAMYNTTTGIHQAYPTTVSLQWSWRMR